MTRPRPTIREAYEANRPAFKRHVPFGVLLKDDMAYLLKATARDAGVTVQEVLDAIACPPRTGRATGPLDRSVTHG